MTANNTIKRHNTYTSEAANPSDFEDGAKKGCDYKTAKSFFDNAANNTLFLRLIQRRRRCSLLDHGQRNSLVSKSDFWGFLNLLYICVGLYMVSDPLIRFYETNRFFDLTLAKVMFHDFSTLFFLWLATYFMAYIPLFTYYLFYYRKITQKTFQTLQIIIEACIVLTPAIICYINNWYIFPTGFSLIFSAIQFMKVHSFSNVILEYHILRQMINVENKTQFETRCQPEVLATLNFHRKKLYSAAIDQHYSRYLENLDNANSFNWSSMLNFVVEHDFQIKPTLQHYFWYLSFPVLVYESNYPRGNSFSILYFLRKLTEMISEIIVLYFVVTRYLIPISHRSCHVPFYRALHMLLWPYLAASILMFFIIFESICNMIAELTYFADREFYHDWWNTTGWDEFSRKWNRPVHEFLLRHVYSKFLIFFNMRKDCAIIATLLYSAIIHEFIMVIMFRTIKFYLFGFMLLQIPLIKISQMYKGKRYGNYVFWIQLAIAIPIIHLLYARVYCEP